MGWMVVAKLAVWEVEKRICTVLYHIYCVFNSEFKGSLRKAGGMCLVCGFGVLLTLWMVQARGIWLLGPILSLVTISTHILQLISVLCAALHLSL